MTEFSNAGWTWPSKTRVVKDGNDSSVKMMENQKESPESLESNFAITIEMLNC